MATSGSSQRVLSGKTVWSRGVTRMAPVFAILFLVLAALATAQDRDHDRDRDRDRDHERGPILILSYEIVPRDFGGGNGGRPVPDAQCDAGFVAVGFHLQSGEYFNQAWLDCAPMRSDGSLGDERRMTARTGAPGGSAIRDARCSNGRALRGLRGRSGDSIDEAIGECSFVRDIAERSDNPGTELTEPIVRPRPGGRAAEAQCPAGFVVTGVRSKSGEYIDHLWVLCSGLQRSY